MDDKVIFTMLFMYGGGFLSCGILITSGIIFQVPKFLYPTLSILTGLIIMIGSSSWIIIRYRHEVNQRSKK